MAKRKTICEKKNHSEMWDLSHLLVSFSSGAYQFVPAHRDGLRGSPNTLYKLKTAGGSMDSVENAQKKNKMAALSAALLLLLDISSGKRDDGVHRAVKVEMSIQGNI